MDGATSQSMSTVKDAMTGEPALDSRRDSWSHGSFRRNSTSLFVDVMCETCLLSKFGQDLLILCASIRFGRPLEAIIKDPKAPSFAFFADSARIEILEKLEKLVELG